MQLDKHEGLQVRDCSYSVKITIEVRVLGYFKVGISISVQIEHSIYVNMWQSPSNIAHI